MQNKTKETKLITLDQLIEQKKEEIIQELNSYATEAFKLGKIGFTFNIPLELWNLPEIKDYITDCMDKADWHFLSIKEYKAYDYIKYIELIISICQID